MHCDMLGDLNPQVGPDCRARLEAILRGPIQWRVQKVEGCIKPQ